MEINSTIRWYQRPLHEYLMKGGKRAIAVHHRRAGKDHVALDITRNLALTKPGSYWHVLPQYSQARKAIWSAVDAHTGKRRIDIAFPHEIRASTNEQEMFIRLTNGSTWQCVGSDNVNSLVGAGVAGIVFSEYAICNPKAWSYLSPILMENNGWALFISTPRGNNHLKAMYDMAVENPEWFAETLTVEQTRAIPADRLEEARRTYIATDGYDLGQALYDQEYLCSWTAALPGAFYAAECLRVRREGRIRDDLPIHPDLPVHRAWDLGVRDSTAIWFFQVVGEQVHLIDYYSAHNVGVEHYADVIEAKGYLTSGGNDYVPHDARVKEFGSGKTRVETMIQMGLKPVVVPRSTDADGHQAIRQTLPHCVFHKRTEEMGFQAVESYQREWDDKLQTFRPNALHNWASHGAKAFQYLSQAWKAQKVASGTPKENNAEQNGISLEDLWSSQETKQVRV